MPADMIYSVGMTVGVPRHVSIGIGVDDHT